MFLLPLYRDIAAIKGLNTLPSLDNLKRWGKRVCDRCPFCRNTQTLHHILSNCSVALDQGRYTWRHNCVLSNIISLIRPVLNPDTRLFSDIPGFLAPGGGSVPPSIIVTNLKPDLFIVNESAGVVVIFELTCPWDGNIERSHMYKEEKYSHLVEDLSRRFRTYLFSVEISVRGQVSRDNKKRLKSFVYHVCTEPKKVFKSIVPICSKVALLASFSIFSARNEPSWSDPSYISFR